MKTDMRFGKHSQVMQFLKRHSSRNINRILGNNSYDGSLHASEGDIGQYRFREVIYKIDELVERFQKEFLKEYGENHEIPPFKWQKSFHDHIIRNGTDLKKHYHYTVNNYQKHNLPDNWTFTNLNYPNLIEKMNSKQLNNCLIGEFDI